MKQYWVRNQGTSRRGVRTTLETSHALYKSESGTSVVWADCVDPSDDNLVFLEDAGEIQDSIAAGRRGAVFEAGAGDAPQAVETRS